MSSKSFLSLLAMGLLAAAPAARAQFITNTVNVDVNASPVTLVQHNPFAA